MTRPLTEARIRGHANGYSVPWSNSINYDPPCLIACPHCLEIVIAAHKLYFDNPGQEHRHRPTLGQQHYGTLEGL